MSKNENTSDVFMNPLELATYLGCTRRTIYKKISAGEIPVARIFGRWKVRKSRIDDWIKKQERKLRKRVVKKRNGSGVSFVH